MCYSPDVKFAVLMLAALARELNLHLVMATRHAHLHLNPKRSRSNANSLVTWARNLFARLNMKHWWFLAAVVIWVLALAPMHYAQGQVRCEEALSASPKAAATVEINWRVAENKSLAMVTNRDLFDYRNDLHPDFSKTLDRLGSENHWIDMGAGKVKAQIEFMKSLPKSSGRPYVTAVSYKINRWFGVPKFSGKLETHEGAFETQPTHEWKKADLITDVMGVFSYTMDLTTTLQKTFDLLKVNGEFYISTSSYGTQFKLPGGKIMMLEEYLATIPGLKVEGKWGRIKIVKEREGIVVPPMRLVRIKDEAPPLRLFEI
jgi:hypothetical protein